MKFCIKCKNTKEDLEKYQNKLFKQGYKWCLNGNKVLSFKNINSPFIFLIVDDIDKIIYWNISSNLICLNKCFDKIIFELE